MSEQSVACRCCGKTLFTSVAICEDGAMRAKVGSAPRLEDNADGSFMRCNHCKKAIRMDVLSVRGAGAQVRVAAKQDCS